MLGREYFYAIHVQGPGTVVASAQGTFVKKRGDTAFSVCAERRAELLETMRKGGWAVEDDSAIVSMFILRRNKL